MVAVVLVGLLGILAWWGGPVNPPQRDWVTPTRTVRAAALFFIAPSAIEIESGETITAFARYVIPQMQAEEEQLPHQQADGTAAGGPSTDLVVIGGTLAGVGFLVLAALLVNRQIRVWEQARAEITALHTEMEQRRGVLQDEVSARTRIGEQLRESQDRLGEIVAGAIDAMITIDEQQRVVMFNRAAERMFGCSEKDALGSPLERFLQQRLQATDARQVSPFAENGMITRSTGATHDLLGVHANGTQFPTEIYISQIEVAGKKLLTAIVRYLTECRQEEAALQECQSGAGSRTRAGM